MCYSSEKSNMYVLCLSNDTHPFFYAGDSMAMYVLNSGSGLVHMQVIAFSYLLVMKV